MALNPAWSAHDEPNPSVRRRAIDEGTMSLFGPDYGKEIASLQTQFSKILQIVGDTQTESQKALDLQLRLAKSVADHKKLIMLLVRHSDLSREEIKELKLSN